MVKTHIKSWFEAWSGSYLNNPETRRGSSKDVVVLQAEYLEKDTYLVEVINAEEYKKPLFSMKG